MKLKKIYLTNDAYVMHKASQSRQLFASDTVSMELDIPTMSVRIDDRGPGGEGTYHVPLACVRCWFPIEERAPVKKAANQ